MRNRPQHPNIPRGRHLPRIDSTPGRDHPTHRHGAQRPRRPAQHLELVLKDRTHRDQHQRCIPHRPPVRTRSLREGPSRIIQLRSGVAHVPRQLVWHKIKRPAGHHQNPIAPVEQFENAADRRNPMRGSNLIDRRKAGIHDPGDALACQRVPHPGQRISARQPPGAHRRKAARRPQVDVRHQHRHGPVGRQRTEQDSRESLRIAPHRPAEPGPPRSHRQRTCSPVPPTSDRALPRTGATADPVPSA